MLRLAIAPALLVFFCAPPACPQSAENVLLVVNRSSPVSRRIGAYYMHRRGIPAANVCVLEAPTAEEINWNAYEQIEAAVSGCLKRGRLQEKILYIVTTLGVPLKVSGGGVGAGTEFCAVDSELCLLYAKNRGVSFRRAGAVPNPFFGARDEAFRHPRFPIYLVTRLAAYDFTDVQAMIDRSLAARNRGKFVIDLSSANNETGNDWLRNAATLLPANRVVLDESATVLYDQRQVIGYAAWGSNDAHRQRRHLGFEWLPGAIVTEFVSSNGRTFERPPEDWNFTTWKDTQHFFAGSPQSLAADYLHDGATGSSGHVYEPYLQATPRPDYLLPAYYHGRTLAESYYLAIPSLSWQNIVLGDPLCKLGRP